MTGRQIHGLDPDEALSLLGSSVHGIDDATARARVAELGPNVLGSAPRFTLARTLGKQFVNLFSLLLDLSALLCFVAEHMQPGEGMGVLGVALLGVSVLNAVFSAAQEMRAERAMHALEKILPREIRARRAGRERSVPIADLAIGDVVVLAEGDRVPADARVIAANGLLVNNAALTGESRAVSLTPEPVIDRALQDATNIAFAGSSVLRGSGEAVVFATGRRSEFGKVAALSVTVRRPPTPLESEVARTVRVLTVIALVMGVVFFAYGAAIGRPLWINVVFMLGIIVANVPEGLLPTLTLALAMGGLRLAKKNVLAKSLNAVEALGAVDVICTDKTGTLTKNELTVVAVADALCGEPLEGAPARRALEAAVAASELHGHLGALTGDPLDVAAANALAVTGGSPEAVAKRIVRHLPFDVSLRRAASVVRQDGGLCFVIKGAWEVVRPEIVEICRADGTVSADPERLAECDRVVHRLASHAFRVIAVASRPLAPGESEASELTLDARLSLLGFLCLEDPLREGVRDAVERCHDAGVKVVLITGDHPDTARAIAERAGILEPPAAAAAVQTGQQLRTLRQDELVEVLRADARVFARTTPEQKLQIVAALKRMGHTVAMTGDGVNDAPALRAADVGIAMGVAGTEVAREAAQIVLLDDDFSSIVAGIEEGRAVFANVQKFTSYVLASNVPEIVPFLVYVALPVPLGLTVIQILCVDLGSDLIPAIGLGREPPDGESMKRQPRGARGRLLSRSLLLRSYGFLGVMQALWSMGMFFTVLVAGGWRYGTILPASDPVYRAATGITLVSVVFLQIANLVGRRYEHRSGLDRGLLDNPLFVVGVGAELAFAWAVLYFPPLSRAIGTGPVSPGLVALAALGCPIFFGLDLLGKRLARR